MTHTVLTTNDLPTIQAMPAQKGDTIQLQDGSTFVFHPEMGWCYGNVIGTFNPVTGGIVSLVVDSAAPSDADGRPDGTIYVQTV